MTDYSIVREDVAGRRLADLHPFQDDDAAISYVLPIAKGGRVEIWRGEKLIAAVDERRCLQQSAA
jgi:hypothetical protein